MIEITIVLVLISILAAMAIPRFGSSVANATGKSAAEGIAADIAYVQAEAIRRQEERTIRFNVTLNQINYNRGEDNKPSVRWQACKGCGICVEECPVDAIEFQRVEIKR